MTAWRSIDIGHEWNYERAHFVDMNMDGRKDCLTARYKEDSSGGISMTTHLVITLSEHTKKQKISPTN